MSSSQTIKRILSLFLIFIYPAIINSSLLKKTCNFAWQHKKKLGFSFLIGTGTALTYQIQPSDNIRELSFLLLGKKFTEIIQYIQNYQNKDFDACINNSESTRDLYDALESNNEKIKKNSLLFNYRNNYFPAIINDLLLTDFSKEVHENGHMALALINKSSKKNNFKIVIPQSFTINNIIIPGQKNNCHAYLRNVTLNLINVNKNIQLFSAGYSSQDILQQIYFGKNCIDKKFQFSLGNSVIHDYSQILHHTKGSSCNKNDITKSINKTINILNDVHPITILYTFYIWNGVNIDTTGKLPKIIIKSNLSQKALEIKYNTLPGRNLEVKKARNKHNKVIEYEAKKTAYINSDFNPYTNINDFNHLVQISKTILNEYKKNYTLLSMQQKQIVDIMEYILAENNLSKSKKYIMQRENKEKEPSKIAKQNRLYDLSKEIIEIDNELIGLINNQNFTNKKNYMLLKKRFNTVLNTLSNQEQQNTVIKDFIKHFSLYKIIYNINQLELSYDLITNEKDKITEEQFDNIKKKLIKTKNLMKIIFLDEIPKLNELYFLQFRLQSIITKIEHEIEKQEKFATSNK